MPGPAGRPWLPIRAGLGGQDEVVLGLADNFLIRKLLQSGIGARMLDRHADEIPLPIEIYIDVLTDLFL